MTISLFIIPLLILFSPGTKRKVSIINLHKRKNRPLSETKGYLRERLFPKSKGHNLLFPSSLNCKVVLLVL